MGEAEAIVTIAAFAAGLMAVWSITWGVVQYARAQRQGSTPDTGLADEVARLQSLVEALQDQVVETQERLEFTERLLTRGREGEEARS
jgi:hypothetical protein